MKEYSAGSKPWPHQPVLYHEIIHAIRPSRAGKFVDCTLGAGGHAYGILEASSPDGQLVGLDLDATALEVAAERLKEYGQRIYLRQVSFRFLDAALDDIGWELVDGIVIDLGFSSIQIDRPERGFSFKNEGPLDMRYDQTGGQSAADLVNELSERELADLLYQYGEERHSRRLARAIVAARPIHTTVELAEIIRKAYPGSSGRIHPATRSFQALRIAVNDELTAIQEFLPQAINRLTPAGRLAVISFHSLEDRIVKQYFRRESSDCICPPEQLVCTCGHKARIKRINRKPISPAPAERQRNPRSRSAKLRVVERME